MTFHTYNFLIFFLPAAAFLYWIANRLDRTEEKRILRAYLALLSVGFTVSAGWICTLTILTGIAVNYCLGKNAYKKPVLLLGIALNAAVLVCFKILSGGVYAPLGLSFYTFSQLAYLIDRYRGERELPFLDYALSILFFAKLAEGPIVNPHRFVQNNLNRSGFSAEARYCQMNDGFLRLTMGLVKKVFLADLIASLANTGFAMSRLTIWEAWITSIAYSMQLYFDFSGYCDIAIGLGKLFGIHLPENFNSPYQAVNIRDFWKRWHMTLTGFLTRYIYIPLGGNRRGRVRTCVNIMAVFLVSGLWHGFGWTFLIWGTLHGLAMVLDELTKGISSKLPKPIGIALTFVFVNVCWIFFRADSLEQAQVVLRGLIDFSSANVLISPEFTRRIAKHFPMTDTLAVAILFVGCIVAFLMPNATRIMRSRKRSVPVLILTAVIFMLCVYMISTVDVTSSLYFNF